MNNKIDTYYYINNDICRERDNILKKLYSDNINSELLDYYNLSIFDKTQKFKQKIKNEFYQSKINKDIILTDQQFEVLSILEHNNLFLSAPTSFGKTFVILEYIKRHPDLKNIIIIVPTLALMNELLRKVYNLFSSKYNILINDNEKMDDEKNIFIFVPERSNINFVNKIAKFGIDLLVIDEIYKFRLIKKDYYRDDRTLLMNKAYLDLIKISKKIVLLGPFINNVTFEQTKLNIIKYYTDLTLVYNQISNCCDKDWYKLISKINDKCLIYFKSPESIYSHIDELLNYKPEEKMFYQLYKKEIDYLENTVSPDWYVIKLLKRGIGIHHGKTPLFLRKFYEYEYSNGKINCLLCTNTLMEGINTPTTSMIIVDPPKDCFELNNLIGRVGRLKPKNLNVGKIYICNNKIMEMFNLNKWTNLTIMAEDKKVNYNDEIIHLNKNDNEEIEKDTNEKLLYLKNNFGITKEMIKKYNLKFDKIYIFATENLTEKFYKSSNIHDCIKTSLNVLINISYEFNTKLFQDLNYNAVTLPYIYYIKDILYKKSIKDMINDFNKKINIKNISRNTNIFIDKILSLKNYVKFTLIKMLDFFDLFNIDVNRNIILKRYVDLLKSIDEEKVAFKVLDDLGIEENDFNLITNLLNCQDEEISTSKLITIIKRNKDKIMNLNISPFSKKNIETL